MEGTMGGTIGTGGDWREPPTESEVGKAAWNDLSSWLGESFHAAVPDRAAVSPHFSLQPQPTSSAKSAAAYCKAIFCLP